MYMKSENGEIEVFLCPEESTEQSWKSKDTSGTVKEPMPSCASAVDYGQQQAAPVPSTLGSVADYNTTEVTASTITDPSVHIDLEHLQISHDFIIKNEPVSEDVENVSGLSRIHNVLISEPDDFEPMGGGRFQLQTEDQHNSHISGESVYIFC
jgi:hypothetical protein